MVIKKIISSFLISFEIFLGLVILYVTYMMTAMMIPVNVDYVYSEDEIQFYVISNGVHTDICLPVMSSVFDWTSVIHTEDFILAKYPEYIGIGWGDKGFYLGTPTWADLKISTTFNAVFLPSETAMHVTYYDYEPKVSQKVIKCSMSSEEYERLIDYVMSSFEKVEQYTGTQIIAGKGYGLKDNFYEANGSYWGFKTCNSWTNEALKLAGVRTSFHALFEEGIMRWIH